MRIFFVVGAQKSGSTWLQRSLNSVDGVHCLGEGHFIDRLVQPIAETARAYNQMMQLVAERVYEGDGFYDVIPDPEFRLMMREWIRRMLLRNAKADPNNILAIGDKTPAHSHHIPTLHALFPNARFIHMLRDDEMWPFRLFTTSNASCGSWARPTPTPQSTLMRRTCCTNGRSSPAPY